MVLQEFDYLGTSNRSVGHLMKIDFIEGFQLSPQQKRLWLLQQDSAAYRAQLAILIEGTLNTDLLKQALQDLVKRHEILRTTFQRLPEMKIPIQVVGDRGSLLWQEVDLTSWDEKEKRIEIFAEEGRYPFDFENGPLLRLTLLTLSKYKYVLLITLPSLCADSWTFKNIFRQTSLLYATAAFPTSHNSRTRPSCQDIS